MNIKAAWKALFGDSKDKLVGELIESLKQNVEMEKKLRSKKYDVINIPFGDDLVAYNDTIETFHDNKWIYTFFVLREREIIQKFKDGGDAEILRGALIAIDDIVGSMAGVSAENKMKREQVQNEV